MNEGSIVFVHGTGVRLAGFIDTFRQARDTARQAGITCDFVDCAWGDSEGVEFRGLSLPDGPAEQPGVPGLDPSGRTLSEEEQDARKVQGEDFAQWASLFADPWWELEKLCIRDSDGGDEEPLPGAQPAWEEAWERVNAYRPGLDMQALLRRAHVEKDLWDAAWSSMAGGEIARSAFEHSARELPEAGQAFARAVVARLHQELVAVGSPGPSSETRRKMVERLLVDWEFVVLAGGTFLWNTVKRLGTPLIARHRATFSRAVAPAIGDILLYQSRGEKIRAFIERKIASAQGPVTVVAHSLGGIACVDLLATPGAPKVHRLVTVGSQAPLLYEIGALTSLVDKPGLPPHFPRWLNVYDRNDMLSYVAERLFEGGTDHEVISGQPFPDAHGAYHGNETMWAAIRDFMQTP
jgi:hypothetical protein